MTLTSQEILSLPVDGPGFPTSKTVGQYLMSPLRKFIYFQDAFDSKRPFGSSDWEIPLVFAFGKADLIWVRTDENGDIEDYPTDRFWEILNELAGFLYDMDFSAITTAPEPKEWYLICVDITGGSKGLFTDFHSLPYTEEQAKTVAADLNTDVKYCAWSVVHIPSAS
jgi:hypothetical protein